MDLGPLEKVMQRNARCMVQECIEIRKIHVFFLHHICYIWQLLCLSIPLSRLSIDYCL